MYPMSKTWQGLVMVLSMASRNALFLASSLSMSRYDVVARSALLELFRVSSSLFPSSMMTHSELPVSGSSLSWKTRGVESELMGRVCVAVGVEVEVKRVSSEWGVRVKWVKRSTGREGIVRVLESREIMRKRLLDWVAWCELRRRREGLPFAYWRFGR